MLCVLVNESVLRTCLCDQRLLTVCHLSAPVTERVEQISKGREKLDVEEDRLLERTKLL